LDNLPVLIKKQCIENNYDISAISFDKKIKISELDISSVELNRCRLHANKKGGKCLSTVYVNSQTKLKWQCAKGHIWEAKPNTIQQGHWCKICHIDSAKKD
jgi:hypothetical protein